MSEAYKTDQTHRPRIPWIFRVILLLAAAYIAGTLAGRLHAQPGRKPSAETSAGTTAEKNTGTSAEKKQIALTFDDGPNPHYTQTLLEGLKKRGVKASFFVLGSEVEKFPDILESVHADGHLIGVHSYEHVNFGQIGDEAAQRQIEKTQEAIHDVTGEYAGFIRPPYGCWKDSLDEKVDMIEVLWDVDPMDWATADADAVVQRILENTEEGSIILLHDASASSVQAAFTVIDALTKQGYEFVTVDELLLE